MQKAVGGRNIRPREDRRRTVLPARIRTGPGWADACILNISSRGLLVYAKCAAQPGSHVKLWRGGYLVVARVVWRSNERLGVCTPEPIPVDDIISSEAAPAEAPAPAAAVELDRPRKRPSHDRSRAVSRAVEFLSLVVFGIALAGAAAAYAYETLSKPLEAVNRALGAS